MLGTIPANPQRKIQKTREGFLTRCNSKITNFFWDIIDVLAHENRKIAELYEKIIGEEYKKEFVSFGISKGNKVLHIGCGAYPLTEIELAKLFNVKVVGIDKNPLAVKLANEVIQKERLGKKIKIEHGDGVNHPVNKFDVIIISSCSSPKLKILEHIFKIAKKQSVIIVREIDAAVERVLEYINSRNDVTQVKKIHHTPFPFLHPIGWNSIYLKKK
jgi:precorrin-6B methylase 2